QEACVLVLRQRRQQRRDQMPARAPGEVKARHGIAFWTHAALDPEHDRQPADPELLQPIVRIRRRTLDQMLRPQPRPDLTRLELGEAAPILERLIWCVDDL